MAKEKKTNIAEKVDSELWERVKGLSAFLKIDKGFIIESALKVYFKALDKFQNEIEKEKGEL